MNESMKSFPLNERIPSLLPCAYVKECKNHDYACLFYSGLLLSPRLYIEVGSGQYVVAN